MNSWDDRRAPLVDLAPALRRAVGLDPRCVVRLRFAAGRATALIRLPFGILVSRAVSTDAGTTVATDGATGPAAPTPVDVTVHAAAVLEWLEDGAQAPPGRDELWRGGLPPERGWTRVETVPDDVIRPLVRQGALTLAEAAAREGVPGAQPRAEVADALLDSVVLTATAEVPADGRAVPPVEVSLRALSALTRMGFLPKGGQAFLDVSGRWVRVVAEFGTVYLERPGSGLTVA